MGATSALHRGAWSCSPASLPLISSICASLCPTIATVELSRAVVFLRFRPRFTLIVVPACCPSCHSSSAAPNEAFLLRPRFAFLIATCSAPFARASLSSPSPMTFAFPRTPLSAERRTLASSLTFMRNSIGSCLRIPRENANWAALENLFKCLWRLRLLLSPRAWASRLTIIFCSNSNPCVVTGVTGVKGDCTVSRPFDAVLGVP
jgi:hypothetical protein